MTKSQTDDHEYLYPNEIGHWDHCMDAGEDIDDVLWKIITLSFSNPAHEKHILDWLRKRSAIYDGFVEVFLDGDESPINSLCETSDVAKLPASTPAVLPQPRTKGAEKKKSARRGSRSEEPRALGSRRRRTHA